MKRAIVIILAVAVALAGLAAVAPLVISAEFVKTRIAAEFIRWSGQAVSFDGTPRISLYPYLTVRLRDAVIPASDGGDEPFIEMDALTGKLEILPLILGRVEVAEFRMLRPRINLRIDADGHSNWVMLDSLTVPPEEGAAAALPEVGRLGQLRIRNGTILVADERSGAEEVLTEVDLDINWPNIAGPASGNGRFVWRKEAVEFNGAVATPQILLSGGASGLRFGIASTPLRLSFDGTAEQLDEIQLDGRMNMTTPSVRRLANWAGAVMPTGPSLGAGSITGSAKWIGSSLSLQEAEFELDGNAGEGAIDFSMAGGRPDLRGTLAFEDLDLTPYLESFRAELLNRGPWPDAPARVPISDAFDFDVRLSAETLLAGNVTVEEVAASTALNDGRLTVSVGEATLYDGALESRFSALMKDGRLEAEAEVKVDAIPVRAALADLIGVAAVDGTASGTVEATSRGGTWGEFVERLDGTATLDIADGTVSGMDVTMLPALIRDPGATPAEGTTAFDAATCSMTIRDGTVTIDALQVRGRGFAVDLTGTAGLFAPTIEARGILAMLPPTDVQAASGVEVPFMITGSWAAPRFLPDLGRPIRRSILDAPATGRNNPNG